MAEQPPTRYELKITASGTVRDKDGNVISQPPLESTTVVTQDELDNLRKHFEMEN